MVEAARLNAERDVLQIDFRVQSATELDEPPGSLDGVFWAGPYQTSQAVPFVLTRSAASRVC